MKPNNRDGGAAGRAGVVLRQRASLVLTARAFPMMYLLKNEEGRGLVIAEASSQAEADAFGFRNLAGYCGRIVEIDPHSRKEAEEFWRVPSLRVARQVLDPEKVGSRQALKVDSKSFRQTFRFQLFVRQDEPCPN